MSNWSGYTHRVRYNEVDPQSIVFNSRYLEFFDAANVEFFRAFGYPLDVMAAAGLDPVVVEVNIRYHASVHIDELLHIGVNCSRLGNTSFDLAFRVRVQDPETGLLSENVATSATITYINVDQVTRQSTPVPDEFRSFLGTDQ
jgi:YbgC/YbaW family acyl-CoA thioester hydrolase